MSEELSDGNTQSSLEESPDAESHSSVEITIGSNNLRIEGTEDFISRELSTILDRIDLGKQPSLASGQGSKEEKFKEEGASENGDSPASDSGGREGEADSRSKLAEVADRLNVAPETLAEYFYIDGGEIHVQNPMEIDPKVAVLGYCSIKEETTGETYHDNTETKKKLIDVEKVDINRWGGDLLYNLRENGYIKDDPNTQMNRNKPFKVTPSGRKKLVEWLNEDD